MCTQLLQRSVEYLVDTYECVEVFNQGFASNKRQKKKNLVPLSFLTNRFRFMSLRGKKKKENFCLLLYFF